MNRLLIAVLIGLALVNAPSFLDISPVGEASANKIVDCVLAGPKCIVKPDCVREGPPCGEDPPR